MHLGERRQPIHADGFHCADRSPNDGPAAAAAPPVGQAESQVQYLERAVEDLGCPIHGTRVEDHYTNGPKY